MSYVNVYGKGGQSRFYWETLKILTFRGWGEEKPKWHIFAPKDRRPNQR